MSLRISTPSMGGDGRRGGAAEPREPDFYMSRLIKLLPAEAVAVYPLLQKNAEKIVRDVKASGGNGVAQTSSTDAIAGAPSGVVSGVSNTAGHVPLDADWLPMAMAWFVLLLVILLRWQATRDNNGNPQWGAVIIAAISFFLWVPTMGGTFGILEFATSAQWIHWPESVKEFIPQVLLMFWTIVIPAFYKPQN